MQRAAVRTRKNENRQSMGIRARRSPKTCVDEAHATSSCLLQYARRNVHIRKVIALLHALLRAELRLLLRSRCRARRRRAATGFLDVSRSSNMMAFRRPSRIFIPLALLRHRRQRGVSRHFRTGFQRFWENTFFRVPEQGGLTDQPKKRPRMPRWTPQPGPDTVASRRGHATWNRKENAVSYSL